MLTTQYEQKADHPPQELRLEVLTTRNGDVLGVEVSPLSPPRSLPASDASTLARDVSKVNK